MSEYLQRAEFVDDLSDKAFHHDALVTCKLADVLLALDSSTESMLQAQYQEDKHRAIIDRTFKRQDEGFTRTVRIKYEYNHDSGAEIYIITTTFSGDFYDGSVYPISTHQEISRDGEDVRYARIASFDATIGHDFIPMSHGHMKSLYEQLTIVELMVNEG